MSAQRDRQVVHPTLGISVKNGATDTCSKCGHTIADEHVPLILWNNAGDLMWVYCKTCEDRMLVTLRVCAS